MYSPQGAVPAAVSADGRAAGVHLRGAARRGAHRGLDGPRHPVRVHQPAQGRPRLLRQRAEKH